MTSELVVRRERLDRRLHRVSFKKSSFKVPSDTRRKVISPTRCHLLPPSPVSGLSYLRSLRRGATGRREYTVVGTGQGFDVRSVKCRKGESVCAPRVRTYVRQTG